MTVYCTHILEVWSVNIFYGSSDPHNTMPDFIKQDQGLTLDPENVNSLLNSQFFNFMFEWMNNSSLTANLEENQI